MKSPVDALLQARNSSTVLKYYTEADPKVNMHWQMLLRRLKALEGK
jgi:hypothetical protein